MSSDIQIELKFNGDSDGFIGQHCESCDSTFKFDAVSCDMQQIVFCPCCGKELGEGRFTDRQREYIQELLNIEAAKKINAVFSRSFSSGSPLKFNPRPLPSTPEPPEEPESDWPIVELKPGMRIKIPRSSGESTLYCPKSGELAR